MSLPFRLVLAPMLAVALVGCGGSSESTPDPGATSTGPQGTSGTVSVAADETSTTGASAAATGSSDATDASETGPLATCLEQQDLVGQVVQTYQESQPLVGLVVSASTEGCEPWSQAWGTADLATDEALTPQHILRAGSVTKSYTAALMLRLEEAGILGLDDTIDLWGLDIPSADEITIRQLLNHTSGLADYQANPTFVEALTADPDRVWTPAELVAYTVELGPVGAPGGTHAYSNANYVIAALVSEDATGGTYRDALYTHVLEPAGLVHTYLEGEDTWDEPTAVGYLVQADGRPQDTTGGYHGSAVWSSGALVGTGDDVRRWMETLLATDFLSAPSQAQLVEWVPAGPVSYGLGIFAVESRNVTAYGHNGAVMGFQAAALYHPHSGATVSVLQNEITVDGTGALATDPTTLATQILEALAAVE